MYLIKIAALLLIPFVPFVIAAARTLEGDRRLAIRFTMLQSRVAGDLSTIAVDNLLKKSRRSTRTAGVPFLERWTRFLGLHSLLLQAGSSWSILQLLSLCLTTLLIAAIAAGIAFSTWWGASLIGLLAGYTPIVVLRVRCRRRLLDMDKALPQVVEMLARALRAGHSLAAAINIVAEQGPEPARSEFGEVFRKQKFGFPLREAFLELLARVPSQDMRVLVTGILVQRDTGGNLTQILDRTSGVIRDRLKLQGDIKVHTAQGRFTGWVLCALPIVLLLIISVVNPGYSKVLTEDPIGRKCLYGGLGLLVVGAFLMRQIITGIEA